MTNPHLPWHLPWPGARGPGLARSSCTLGNAGELHGDSALFGACNRGSELVTHAVRCGSPSQGTLRQQYHLPSHFDTAHISVEVQKRPNADGLGHDLIQLGSLGRIQVQHAEDELAQVGAISIRYWGKRPAHDLQH